MQKLATAQVEQELGEKTEFSRQFEGVWLVFLIFSESCYKLDEHSVEPSDDVHWLLSQSTVD